MLGGGRGIRALNVGQGMSYSDELDIGAAAFFTVEVSSPSTRTDNTFICCCLFQSAIDTVAKYVPLQLPDRRPTT